jgi:hypothetical protein
MFTKIKEYFSTFMQNMAEWRMRQVRQELRRCGVIFDKDGNIVGYNGTYVS